MRNSPRSTLLNKQNALSFFFFLIHSPLLLPLLLLLLLGSKQAKCEKQTFFFLLLFEASSPLNVRFGVSPLSIRHYFPDSRPFCSNTYPGRNPSQRERERALMPISPPIAASTELNACTSPPQQPFNNLSNQAGLSTPQHGFHSHFFLTQQSYYTCFFFFLVCFLSLLPCPSHTYMTHKALFFGLLSEVIVRNMGKLAGRSSSELMLSQYNGKI